MNKEKNTQLIHRLLEDGGEHATASFTVDRYWVRLHGDGTVIIDRTKERKPG